MLRSLWRSIDRFSVQHFQYVINELRKIKVVDEHNRELVMNLLQSVVEIVTYGDRQDPHIFECFMERQVLADFVRILKISQESKIDGPLLQYLSIMIQNMDSEHAIFYCFSNGYMNNIILHPYKFDGGDLAPYYVSFLRAISNKINKDTLCLLVNVQGDAVVSFPLYTEALRFAQHEEKMIQTAIRALVLNIYNVSDDMVYQFISTPPVSEYFSDLVRRLSNLCFCLDDFVYDKGKMDAQKRRDGVILEADKIADELHYFKDILSVGEPRLTRLVTENLLNGLVFPLLFSFMASKNKNGSDLSAITSLYIISCLLQVVGGRSMINNVAGVILYHILNLNVRIPSEGNASDVHDDVKTFSKCLNEVERVICYDPESNGSESINVTYLGAHWEGFMSSFNINSSNSEICSKRSGIFAFVFCEDQSLLLASIFLLLILTESKDLDCLLSSMSGLSEKEDEMLQTDDTSISKSVDESIFIRFMPEILNALLNVLAFQQPLSIMMLWNAGWCLQKLLNFHREGLNGDNLLLFTAFILHFQLKTFILKESGIPCGIAFSNSEIRDIYVIPVASGIIGKLLLAEKHPFRSRHGVVIAIAPLAGLFPKIDEDHPSWLHLQIREFDPQFYSTKARGNHLSMPDHLADGRWTLGFPNARACEEAHLVILNEITKQRSAVEYMLAPLLQDDLELAKS
ncbi:protein TRANSPARENT TESTA 9-like isoform X5 [Glycine soja]|uniref:protein TRANSPARENT TESTA 9-like isoform X5 n=1 Tax=Glycine soja TaxID=3848 RepID=UPI0007191D0C|nr:protein TRANSPARENT TESTA 9-like isoform X5 [Glycine soja]|eukprot:XP_014623923.1 protein TRANSPARENT TESTA 9 isoform X6 [Glycine max]